MPTINNIFNIRIVSVSNSSSVNLGNTLNLNPATNSKQVGDSVDSVGDLSKIPIIMAAKKNAAIDPDAIDQSQST
ncbi:MAG: spore germination protein [Bacilli bacterium]